MSSSTLTFLFATSFLVAVIDGNALAFGRTDNALSKFQSRMKDDVTTTSSCVTSTALGMESGQIPDSAITASSWLKYNAEMYGPWLARLNLSPLGPWIKHEDDTAPWIQVDLGQHAVVTGLQTQGGAGQDKAVTSFKVQAGTQPCMEYIPDTNGTPKVFYSAHTLTTHTLPQPVDAQYIRIEPVACGEYCALRFEILGCGIEWCPAGWDEYNGDCYFFGHYASIHYSEAVKECTNRGASLASVHSEAEQDFLTSYVQGSTADVYLLGLNDIATEGTFVWIDGTPMDYTKWAIGQPSNYGGNEDCAGLWKKKSWVWNDVKCTDAFSFICKKPKESTKNRKKDSHLGIIEASAKDFDGALADLTTQAVCLYPAKLGIENGNLPTSFISVSTVYKDDATKYGAAYSRLNTAGKRWLPHHTDFLPWIQVDIYGRTNNVVSGVITQGYSDQWVTAFKVRGGTMECDLQHIVGSDNAAVVFNGNTDSNTEVTHLFTSPMTWRFVRIEPTSWSTWPSFRFDVIGCTGLFTAACESDWVTHGDFCYYFAHTSKGTFSQAETDCQSKGAFLASIHSVEEHDFTAANVQDDGSHRDFGYWIGFQDRDKEGTFEWVDGTWTNYVNWEAGQPNNYGGQDCTSMWARKAWKWTDLKCADTYLAHVCKKLRI